MRAMVLEQPGRVLALHSLPVPGPRELLLRVEACAVCRTDLHIVDGELTDPALPLIAARRIGVYGFGAAAHIVEPSRAGALCLCPAERHGGAAVRGRARRVLGRRFDAACGWRRVPGARASCAGPNHDENFSARGSEYGAGRLTSGRADGGSGARAVIRLVAVLHLEPDPVGRQSNGRRWALMARVRRGN